MSEDLDLTGNRYQWLLNIFYISYILFEVQVIMWKIMPPHIWATIVVLGWGLIATLQAATFTWSAEMVCRFLLGVTEAGFGPGIPYLLSFFYLRHELGLRCGIFLSCAPLATTFAGIFHHTFKAVQMHSNIEKEPLLMESRVVTPELQTGDYSFWWKVFQQSSWLLWFSSSFQIRLTRQGF